MDDGWKDVLIKPGVQGQNHDPDKERGCRRELLRPRRGGGEKEQHIGRNEEATRGRGRNKTRNRRKEKRKEGEKRQRTIRKKIRRC